MHNFLVYLVYVAIGAIILIGIVVTITNVLKSAAPEAQCEISVFTTGAAEAKEFSGFNCPKQVTEITFKDIDKKTGIEGEKAISNIVADHLASCWRRLGEGGRTPFARSFLSGNKEFTGDSMCVICSDITFDEIIKDKIRSVKNLEQVLRTKEYAESKSYYDYLYPHQSGKDADIYTKLYKGLNLNNIDTSKKVVVYYGVMKPTFLTKVAAKYDLIVHGEDSSPIDLPDVAVVSINHVNNLPTCSRWFNQPPPT